MGLEIDIRDLQSVDVRCGDSASDQEMIQNSAHDVFISLVVIILLKKCDQCVKSYFQVLTNRPREKGIRTGRIDDDTFGGDAGEKVGLRLARGCLKSLPVLIYMATSSGARSGDGDQGRTTLRVFWSSRPKDHVHRSRCRNRDIGL